MRRRSPGLPRKPSRSMPPNPELLPPCKVCGGKASGFHYGVNTCEACKAFFKRSLLTDGKFPCYTRAFNCNVSTGIRNPCPHCRYQRCMDVGMSKSAIKNGRYSHSKRARDLEEIRSLSKKEWNVQTPPEEYAKDNLLSDIDTAHTGRRTKLSNDNPMEYIPKWSRSMMVKSERARVIEPVPYRSDLDMPPDMITPDGRFADELISEFSVRDGVHPSADSVWTDMHYERNNPLTSDKHDSITNGIAYIDLSNDTPQFFNGDSISPITGIHDDIRGNTNYSPVNDTDFFTSGFENNSPVAAVKQEPYPMQPCKRQHEVPLRINYASGGENNAIERCPKIVDPDVNMQSWNENAGEIIGKYYDNSSINTNDIMIDNAYTSVKLDKNTAIESMENIDIAGVCNQQTSDIILDAMCDQNDVQLSTSDTVPNDLTFQPIEPTITNAGTNVKELTSDDINSHKVLHDPVTPTHSRSGTPVQCDQGTPMRELNAMIAVIIQANKECHPMEELLEKENEVEELHRRHYEKSKERERLFGQMRVLSKEEHKAFLEETGIDVDNRHEFMAQWLIPLEEDIFRLVRFAKSIPGFNELSAEDQGALVKASRFEYFLLCFHRGVHLSLEMTFMITGEVYDADEISRIWDKDFVRESIQQARSLRKIDLSPDIVAILKAICIMFTDRFPLENPCKVEVIQLKLIESLDVLLSRDYSENARKMFYKIWNWMISVRKVSSWYHQLGKMIVVDFPVVSKSPLLTELFKTSAFL